MTIRLEEDDFFLKFEVSEESQGHGPLDDDEFPPNTDPRTIWSCFDGATDDETIILSGYTPGAWGYWLSGKHVPQGEEYEVVCTADRDPEEEGPFVVILFKEKEYLSVYPFRTRELAVDSLASVQAEHPVEGWVMTKARWDDICATLPPGGREGLLRGLGRREG